MLNEIIDEAMLKEWIDNQTTIAIKKCIEDVKKNAEKNVIKLLNNPNFEQAQVKYYQLQGYITAYNEFLSILSH